MHIVDEIFADEIEAMDGFEAYHALDCGGGEIVSISLLRDQAAAEESDERTLEFVGRELGDFDTERTEVIGGEVIVSRAMATLLEPSARMKQVGRGGASPAPPPQPRRGTRRPGFPAPRRRSVTRRSSPADVDEHEVASRKAHFERLHAAS